MIDLREFFELDAPSALVRFPCGCVIETGLVAEKNHFICPWCECAFLDTDLRDWLSDDTHQSTLFLGDAPKPMIRWQKVLHEVFDEQEGLPVLRVGNDLVRVDEFEWVAN